jgi:hypothetical protein
VLADIIASGAVPVVRLTAELTADDLIGLGVTSIRQEGKEVAGE